MKILRIVYDWPPPWSGLAPHPYEVSVAQAAKGHEIFVLSGRWPRQGEPIKHPNVSQVHFLGNSSLPFRAPLPGTMLVTIAPLMLFRYLSWRLKNTPDVLHIHGSVGLWILLYRLILKKIMPRAVELKLPLVVHFHNTVAGRQQALQDKGESISPISKYFDWPLARWSDTLAVKIADALIFVSQANKEEAMKHYNADEGKCFVVETGVNTELFKPVDVEEREKSRRDLDLDNQDKIILYHGLMLERKNIHLLVEALKYLPENYRLFLAGPFADTAYADKINDITTELGLKDRVISSGYTPYPEVPIAYQVSDLFVLPSSWEGLPKVVMQGLACGVPCLVSGFKVVNEIRGLYYLGDLKPESIASQIREILDNEQNRQVDVQKINDLYSWENRVDLIDQIYEKVKSS
jgi:glycosyltransferase involved in cell wall biosynthesis